MRAPDPSEGRGLSSSMRTAGLCAVVLAGALIGCAPPADRNKLIKEVIEKDPAFGAVLEKHRELTSRIQTYQRELDVRRSTVEKSIQQLRRDLADTAASVRTKIDDVRKRMDPDRKRLELALNMTAEELKTRRVQRASLGRQIAQLKKSAGDNDPRLTEVLRDAQRLDQETASLQEQIRLLKIKLVLIRL